MTNGPGFWKSFVRGLRGEAPAAEAGAAPEPDDYPNSDTAYQEGFRLFREGRLEEAARAFSKAISHRPTDTCAWEMFGCSLGNLGRYEESLRAFDRAMELGHECENCWYNRSIAYTALGRRQETIDALERVTQLNPEHTRAWLDLGMLLAGFRLPENELGEPFDGRQERAVACFDAVVATDPNYFEAWLGRGLMFERLAHQAQVRNRIAAITGAPELPFEERVRAAAESFDRAAAIRPDDPRAAEAKESLYAGLFGEDRANWPVGSTST